MTAVLLQDVAVLHVTLQAKTTQLLLIRPSVSGFTRPQAVRQNTKKVFGHNCNALQ